MRKNLYSSIKPLMKINQFSQHIQIVLFDLMTFPSLHISRLRYKNEIFIFISVLSPLHQNKQETPISYFRFVTGKMKLGNEADMTIFSMKYRFPFEVYFPFSIQWKNLHSDANVY